MFPGMYPTRLDIHSSNDSLIYTAIFGCVVSHDQGTAGISTHRRERLQQCLCSSLQQQGIARALLCPAEDSLPSFSLLPLHCQSLWQTHVATHCVVVAACFSLPCVPYMLPEEVYSVDITYIYSSRNKESSPHLEDGGLWKYLGIVVDNNLNMSSQCDSAAKRDNVILYKQNNLESQ